MKKIILIVITLLVALFVYINVNALEIVIPSAAIRVRVIANSNSIRDQNMKMKVKEYVEREISPKLVGVDNINDARSIINSNIDYLDNGISNLFRDSGYDMKYSIKFGDNYFPDKDYKGIHYDAGTYESLVVTIGSGSGDNWWCVLFPPLCLLEGDDSDALDVEYKFFIKEMLSKISFIS